MGTDFYKPDRLHWRIPVTSGNQKVGVIEDPNGSNDFNEISLPLDPGSGAEYYATGWADPDNGTRREVDVLSDLQIAPLYNYIQVELSQNSPNNLDYEFQAITPTNSNLVNSGLRLTTVGQSVPLQLVWSSDRLSPRYFGFQRGTGQSSVSTSIDGPVSRWGMWQSPKSAGDKRQPVESKTFSESDSKASRDWRWTKGDRMRRRRYYDILSPHVYPHDRADRAALADDAGLPTGDHNNALFDLWRQRYASTEQRIVVQENAGESDLELATSSKPISVGYVANMDKFWPEGDTEHNWPGEAYGLSVVLGLEPFRKYNTNNVTPYRH